MRFKKLCGLVVIWSVALSWTGAFPALARPEIPLAGEAAQSDAGPRITPEELRALLRRRKAVIIDVRSLEAYKGRHIKGALSIPVDEIEARVRELPRGKMIATYCS